MASEEEVLYRLQRPLSGRGRNNVDINNTHYNVNNKLSDYDDVYSQRYMISDHDQTDRDEFRELECQVNNSRNMNLLSFNQSLLKNQSSINILQSNNSNIIKNNNFNSFNQSVYSNSLLNKIKTDLDDRL